MSNTNNTPATFRVTYHGDSGLEVLDVKGADYETSGGELHIAGAGEVGVFAAGKWVYCHGTTNNDPKEN